MGVGVDLGVDILFDRIGVGDIVVAPIFDFRDVPLDIFLVAVFSIGFIVFFLYLISLLASG